jgi:hypothetical protein
VDLNIAPQLAARVRRAARGGVISMRRAGAGGTVLPQGVPILVQQFPLGPNQLNLAVEIAWGAQISTPESTWKWTEVSQDVLSAPQIVTTIGRSDESSTPQPAQVAMTLLNTSGNYSYGAQSANYPNVHKNVPVRVSVIYQGVQYTRFLGYSTGFTPTWDTTGNYAAVNLTAAGVKRRLNQAVAVVQSVLRTAIPTQPGLIGYWPMEDGSTATSFASAIPSVGPMSIGTGGCQPASSTTILASNPLPVLNAAAVYGVVFGVPPTGTAQMRFVCVFPPATEEPPSGSQIACITTSGGSLEGWYLFYSVGGGLFIRAVDANGNTQYQSSTYAFGVDGQAGLLSFSFIQSGANVNAEMSFIPLGVGEFGPVDVTIPNQTLGNPIAINVNPFGLMGDFVVGHVQLLNVYASYYVLLEQANGYDGEYSIDRMIRLTAQQGEYIYTAGQFQNQKMGEQTPDTFINLVEGCAVVEDAYLYDGLQQGLSVIAHDQITSQVASMTLDASLGQIAPPLTPLDDDQLTVNEYTAYRVNGSSATWTDTYSPLQVANIGEYSQSTTQDFYSDGEQLTDFAAWKVNVGTVNDYRWTPVIFWLHHNPELLPTWLNTLPMSNINVTNLSDERAQLSDLTVRLLLEGYTETIDQFTWTVSANCSSYLPWVVMTSAQDTGDTSQWIGRADTDGAELTQSYPAGSTSLSVATPSGPLWTTVADDFPLVVNIGGNPITVTTITGSSSPQTFTVTGSTVVAPLANGASVSVWEPAVLEVIRF